MSIRSVSIINLIREYTGSDETNGWIVNDHREEMRYRVNKSKYKNRMVVEPPSRLHPINAVLMRCFDGIDWQRINPNTFGHNQKEITCEPRPVYICKEADLVVKLDFQWEHALPRFPYADEVASELCKWLGWKEIPETVIIHETQSTHPEFNRYAPFMFCFLKEGQKKPITFTFQTAIYGTTLPLDIEQWRNWNQKNLPISLSSFHKAYLLALFLGKHDAYGSNSMYVSKTGEIREIDNEHIGMPYYAVRGALQYFNTLKQQTVSPEILADILRMDPMKLCDHLLSYVEKNENLAGLWQKHASYKNLKQELINFVEAMCGCLLFLQAFIAQNKSLNLEEIEEEYEKHSLRLDNEELYNEVEEQRKKFASSNKEHLRFYTQTI